MIINEIFVSLQGEGSHMGYPTVFVRLTGCNLRCAWCDTKYAYEGGEEMEVEAIVSKVRSFDVEHVCITGGEPLEQDILPLIDNLQGLNVSVETNGSKDISELAQRDVLISLDIKCPSSGETEKNLLKNLGKLRSTDQLKFVVADKTDYDFAKNIIAQNDVKCRIIFTPVGGVNLNEVALWILEDNLKVSVLPQLHKLIWPEDERGR